MDVNKALLIGDLAFGQVIAGKNGTDRIVHSIEVMEVPEVLSWVTPGLLVMTTFYAIKDDANKQIEVVDNLIAKDAAGIVIKIGRFVDTLPEEMLQLADRHDFPIISLPKTISYINVLTPLIETLYKEKQAAQSVYNPFGPFMKLNFSTVTEAINYIADLTNTHLYIEDIKGQLLYVSNDFLHDGWRQSGSLFSKPVYTDYEKRLIAWQTAFSEEDSVVHKISGYRERIVFPLIFKKEIFAFVHLQIADKGKDYNRFIKKLGKKLSDIFMNEQLHIQKERVHEREQIEAYFQQWQHTKISKSVVLVLFRTNWTNQIDCSDNDLIDHSGFIRLSLMQLLAGLDDYERLFFEKNHHFHCLFIGNEADLYQLETKLKSIVSEYNEKHKEKVIQAAISPLLNDDNSLESALRLVAKTMEIGRKVKPDDCVFSHKKLGIYEILIRLASDSLVKEYVGTVLRPLEQERNSDLLHTLEVYLHENGNVTKTSQQLYIHRRTLLNRLKKIEELLDMDLNSANNRFILSFCLKLHHL